MTILLSPGSPGQLTGGYRYNARIVAGLEAQGDPVEVIALPGRWPLPEPDDVRRCHALLDGLPSGARVVLDGLALAAAVDRIEALCMRTEVSLLLHSAPHTERGTSAADAVRLYGMTTRTIQAVHRVIATSEAAADEIRGLFPVSEIAVVPPGCDVMPASVGAGSGRLLCVATLTPRKGHRTLVAALARIPALPWRLTCVGSLTRTPAHVAAIQADIQAAGLSERIDLIGERDDAALAETYRTADAFVLPTWHESYGMVLTEAMSAGLPIISTTAGAVPQTVPAGAGILVPPGDAPALSAAIAAVLTDRSRRDAMAAAAAAHPVRSWARAAAEFAQILDEDG